jgi:hypothetical protein
VFYVRDKVYTTKVTEVEDLKALILDGTTTINTVTLARIWEEMEFRLDVLLVKGEDHSELR